MPIKTDPLQNSSPGITPPMPWRIAEVHPLEEYELKICFIDGLEGIVDMTNLIMGSNSGVFSILRDKKIFDKVFLQYGVLTWPGELDLAPDTLYDEIKKQGKCILF
jgi:hypothetical protein